MNNTIKKHFIWKTKINLLNNFKNSVCIDVNTEKRFRHKPLFIFFFLVVTSGKESNQMGISIFYPHKAYKYKEMIMKKFCYNKNLGKCYGLFPFYLVRVGSNIQLP